MLKISVLFYLLVGYILLCNGLTYQGVNQSGAEWGSVSVGNLGENGTAYIFPIHSSFDFFMSHGANIFRLPFQWERLQPTIDGSLNAVYLSQIQAVVSYVTKKGGYVILDVHNYARYYGNVISTSGAPTNAQFGTFWGLLANEFKSNGKVIFGLMNEPHDVGAASVWLASANAAISAIRGTEATNLILVPGTDWTGAWSWDNNNAAVMAGVVDSGNNFVFEVHQYFDSGYQGKSDCIAGYNASLFDNLSTWLKQNNFKAFLGEFGGTSATTCQEDLTNVLNYLNANSDLYIGWTYWAAGYAWNFWNQNNNYAIEPNNGVAPTQFTWLEPFLADTGTTGSNGGGSGTTGSDGGSSGTTGGDGGDGGDGSSSSDATRAEHLLSSVLLY